jgi:hypothetical protein
MEARKPLHDHAAEGKAQMVCAFDFGGVHYLAKSSRRIVEPARWLEVSRATVRRQVPEKQIVALS